MPTQWSTHSNIFSRPRCGAPADSLSSERLTVEAVRPRLLCVASKGQARAVTYSVLQAHDLGPLVVTVRTPNGQAALAWAKPDLIEVLASAKGGHGRHLPLSMGFGMAVSGPAKPRAKWRCGELLPDVRLLLDQAGLACTELD